MGESLVLGLDSETARFRPGLQAPPLTSVALATDEAYELVGITEAKPYVVAALESDCLIVGANVAYDMSVFAAEWPDVIPAIFEAYERDRVTDVIVREKLQHIGTGIYRRFERTDGQWVHLDYALEHLARRHLGLDLSDPEGWQLRFGELRAVPISSWPEGARNYAVTDVIATLGVYRSQDESPDERELLHDQFRQARAAWWLQLMRCWGLHTDEKGVREFARRTQQEYDRIAGELVALELARFKRTRHRDGTSTEEYVRNTKNAAARVVAAYQKRGEAPPMTAPSKRFPRGQVQLDYDACDRSGDPVMRDYAEFSSLGKKLSSDVPLLMSGIKTPIQPNFEVLLETGRTSSSPNVQNLPREVGMRECFVPRRGMLYAAADYSQMELRTVSQVMITCVLGGVVERCNLAMALNRGFDPHLQMAARILKISYEEAKANKKRDDVDRARQSGKVCNFGYPGGLGPESFVHYARNQYGVILDENHERAVEIARELKRVWLESWPEFREYFRWIGAQTEQRVPRIKHLFSDRYRGNVSFTEASNSMFQGLAADCAKVAGFLIAKACYADESSVLYGCRPVNFVHDEFIVEVPDDALASNRAKEVARLMKVGADPYLPDVPSVVEPLLMRRLSKKAETIYDGEGNLVPWDMDMAA